MTPRQLLQQPLCALLGLFFRRIEVAGREHAGQGGPVIFVLNHPNALIDPLILLCRAGRRVSFLAKEPLFRMPVIGWIVRVMDSIPVYRRMDQADPAQNAATFAAARQLLGRGGSLAVFPEGTSHSDPRLKPFRTGAARIALGARVEGLHIVPAGLFYTEKTRFRSQALLCFGPPVPVDPVAAGDGEPPPEAVQALTARLEHALGSLTLQADAHEALRLAGAAERILHSAAGEPRELADRVALRRRLLDGYTRLKASAPGRLAEVTERIERYQAALQAAHLTPERLPGGGYRTGTVLRHTLATVGLLLVLFPPAVLGLAAHAPAWLVVDLVGRRYRRSTPDLVSTVKLIAGLVFYPLTWVVLAGLGWSRWGGLAAVVALGFGPLTALAALAFVERSRRLLGGARGLFLALTARRRFLRLVAEREAIRHDLDSLSRELDSTA